MIKKILRITSLLTFIVGLSILLYPRIQQYIFKKNTDSAIKSFQNTLEDIKSEYKTNSKKASEEYNSDYESVSMLDKLYANLLEENKRLFDSKQSNLVEPFSYEQPSISLDEYGLLNNMIGYIIIDKMNIQLPVYLGANKENMSLGAVHLTNTSYPIGGNNSNCVIAAHRGSVNGVMFKDIDLLEIGDKVIFVNFLETLTYTVTEYQIIKPEEIDKITIQENKDMITLISCNPYGQNYERYIVYCERK